MVCCSKRSRRLVAYPGVIQNTQQWRVECHPGVITTVPAMCDFEQVHSYLELQLLDQYAGALQNHFQAKVVSDLRYRVSISREGMDQSALLLCTLIFARESGDMTQLVQSLPRMHETLGSHSPAPLGKRNNKTHHPST